MALAKPVFAVVGHPNKGKSSIVSTLTRQDAVRISELSGTTTEAQAFELIIDGLAQYTLVDTPGFQRPRQALEWLLQQVPNAAERSKVVELFVQQQATENPEKFRDEIELLTPITKGAGIIYVVDGSLPYSAEYEAEMTILQWTGQPRMALINPIEDAAYVGAWQSALSQFFSIVRVFDPLTADQHKQLTVLSAFAELHEPWRAQVEQTIEAIKLYSQQLTDQGAMLVAEHLISMLSHTSEIKVPAQFAQSALEEKLKKNYQQALRDIESAMQRQLQSLFAHSQMQVTNESLNVDVPDLFDSDHWYQYGLDRQTIIALATSAGAAAGAAIDLSVGGASLMAGALAGGLVSGIASLAATWRPERLNIRGVPLAGKTLMAGPVKELTFAYVLLGRSLDFFDMIQQRTHADRRLARVEHSSMNSRIKTLSQVSQVKLTALLHRAHKGLTDKEINQLKDLIVMLITGDAATS